MHKFTKLNLQNLLNKEETVDGEEINFIREKQVKAKDGEKKRVGNNSSKKNGETE